VRAKHQANLMFVLDFSGRTGREGGCDLLISIADMFVMWRVRGWLSRSDGDQLSAYP
jgi:hypothetical protein